ncbi:MAG: hypothetical protein ACT4P7_08055 [Gemmatimonadaceae bacterium]
MLSNEKQAVQVFRRVRDFLEGNAPPVGYGSVEKLVAQLKGVVQRLEVHAREQDARSRQARAGTTVKRLLAVSIRREFLRPITRSARALFRSDDALQSALSMPKVRDYEGTIAAAEAMAQTATLHRQRFVEAGFPEDFVERMQKAAADLREGINVRAQEFAKRSASTAGLRQEYARGRNLVRVLDSMVAPRLASAPDRLAEWQSISRFARLSVPQEIPVVAAAVGDGAPVAPIPNGSEPVTPSSGAQARAV